MKKLYILTIATLFYSIAFAQTFSLTPKNIDVWNTNNNVEVMNVVMINNTSNDADSMFTWKCIGFNLPASWKVTFCDNVNCYNVYGVTDSSTFKIKKGRGYTHKIDIDYYLTNGNGELKFIVKSVLDPLNIDTIVVNATSVNTSVKETAKVKAVSFSPNPVKSDLTFKFPSHNILTVDIYNILGMKVKSFTHSAMETEVNLAELKNGVYFVRFADNGKLYTKQFTKAD